jgi:hypothetical protein
MRPKWLASKQTWIEAERRSFRDISAALESGGKRETSRVQLRGIRVPRSPRPVQFLATRLEELMAAKSLTPIKLPS